MSVFLTSKKIFFSCPWFLCILPPSWDASTDLPWPLSPFPTHCLTSSQTRSFFSCSDLGCLCSHLLQCVLVQELSTCSHFQFTLSQTPPWILTTTVTTVDHTHTAVAQRRSKAVGESCPVSPLCSPVFPHTSVVSCLRLRQEQPFYSACLHCSLQNWSSVLRSTSTNKITLSNSPFSKY